MNPRIQAHASRRRTQRCRREAPTPPPMPPSCLADVWPAASDGPRTISRCATVARFWDLGRSLAARCWPTRLDHRRRPALWRLARIVWTVAGLTIYVGTIALCLAWLLTRPLTTAACWVLVNRGWSPPLNADELGDLADPDTALFDEDHEHAQAPATDHPPAPAHPTVAYIDPEQARQEAADARQERQTAALEALAHQPQPPPGPVPAPTPQLVSYPRRPVSLRRWILRALVVASVLSGIGLVVTAWTLAALSAAGTIPEPPTNAELIEGINARTEQRQAEIADRVADYDLEGSP